MQTLIGDNDVIGSFRLPAVDVGFDETEVRRAASFSRKLFSPSEHLRINVQAIEGEVFNAVSPWRITGRKLHLKTSTLDAYASAFEHPLMDEAGRLLGK